MCTYEPLESVPQVYRGLMNGIQDVAVKTLLYGDELQHKQFLLEIHLLRQLSHHQNIVQFYGACMQSPHPMLVLVRAWSAVLVPWHGEQDQRDSGAAPLLARCLPCGPPAWASRSCAAAAPVNWSKGNACCVTASPASVQHDLSSARLKAVSACRSTVRAGTCVWRSTPQNCPSSCAGTGTVTASSWTSPAACTACTRGRWAPRLLRSGGLSGSPAGSLMGVCVALLSALLSCPQAAQRKPGCRQRAGRQIADVEGAGMMSVT